MPDDELAFRDGSAADLAATFAISEHAMHESATRQGVIPPDHELTDAEIRGDWLRRRPLLEFMAAQPHGRYVICENGEGPLGYARVVRFDGMEELTELMVEPDHQGQGIGRRLLDLAWPGDPTPELGRVVVATGAASDLSLYIGAGVMPVSGHWQLRQGTSSYLARRSLETDTADPAVHVLKPERAVAEWKRLEPPAVGHDRPGLHDFFGRDRTCLALIGENGQDAEALCWVSSDAEIGPAVAATPGQLVPVVLAALDRVAMTQQPTHLSVYATTISWWLLRRLRTLGFSVYWPGWILCSNPLPGLDRYVPTRPPHVL
ncbi:MAG: hypothetical protein NVSMB25_18900 [Thermoleophilaceae bacterium]